jgi:hypothetical protein
LIPCPHGCPAWCILLRRCAVFGEAALPPIDMVGYVDRQRLA